MSCSPFELKDYFLGELPAEDRSAVEHHVASCSLCREELAALNTTRAVLLSVPDEEPPRRIAFVSDKVFEPRWWQRLWNSGPQLGFAAAAMLAIAIVIHAFAPAKAAPAAEVAQVSPAVIEAEVAKRVQVEVARAVTASQQQQMAQTLDLLNARLRDVRAQRREDLLRIAEIFERLQKRQSMSVKRAIYE